jgi:enamine deaminase RidA (YjgF/YER057c/UK114 family)
MPEIGEEFLQIRDDCLGDQLAASATIGIGELAYPEMLVEVQCTAARQS